MQRIYKLILSIIVVILSGVFAFAQEKQEYKDVILDGKPAKLNILTGEITLVKKDEKKVITRLDNTSNNTKKEIRDSIAVKSNSSFHVVGEKETLFPV